MLASRKWDKNCFFWLAFYPFGYELTDARARNHYRFNSQITITFDSFAFYCPNLMFQVHLWIRSSSGGWHISDWVFWGILSYFF